MFLTLGILQCFFQFRFFALSK